MAPKHPHEVVVDRLNALGVERWDTAPPEQGRIRFLNGDGRVVASGCYQVVLSYGPSEQYTMGWAIGAYRAAGIPFVARTSAGEPAAVHGASREQAWARGLEVAAGIECDLLYWCSTLLVAVTEFREGDDGGPRPDLATREAGLLEARFATAEMSADLTGPEKRRIYDSLPGLGLRREMITAMAFVLEGDGGEVEVSRDDVTAADVPALISAYWKVWGWRQRTYMIHLLADQSRSELQSLWLDILRAPDDDPGTALHAAKALALARLDGDVARFDYYYGNYAETRREALRRVHEQF